MTSNNKMEIIKNIFKAVATKNAVIVIENDYNEYSIENFILLIVRAALKKMDIDENIVQIVKKSEVSDETIDEFDLMITDQKVISTKSSSDKVYVYQEDDYFNDIVKDEIKRLCLSGKNVELLNGDFETVIKKINKSNNYASAIYTKDRKLAYEFINRINSDNVFFNSTLQNAKDIKKCKDLFFRLKNISCEFAF